MNSAKAGLEAELQAIQINMPKIPVYSNITAQPYTSVDDIRDMLGKQLISPVHWEQTLGVLLSNDVAKFCEAGPGAQLKSMMRNVNRKAFAATTVLDK